MLEKNKTLNSQHLKNVIHVVDLDPNQAMMLGLVQCAEDMVKLDRVRDFLLFNKLVHNVLDLVKKSQIHVQPVMPLNQPSPLQGGSWFKKTYFKKTWPKKSKASEKSYACRRSHE